MILPVITQISHLEMTISPASVSATRARGDLNGSCPTPGLVELTALVETNLSMV